MAAKGTQAWPYRLVADAAIKSTCWFIDPDTDNEQEFPSSLPNWDYNTDLRLRRRLAVDLVEGRRSAGLPDTAPLAVSVRWSVMPSCLRGVAAWVPLVGDHHDLVLDVELPGERLGGVLHLETLIVLAEAIDPLPATARRAGSSLWNDAADVRLQGDAALYPVALVPFSKSSLPDKAAWFLELGPDLNAAAMGAIQLLVNQEHPLAASAVGRAGAPSDVDGVVLEMLRADVLRSMVERALGDDAFSVTEDFDSETLGAVLQGLLTTYLSSTSPADLIEIRHIRDNDPSLFAALIQSAAAFLAGRP